METTKMYNIFTSLLAITGRPAAIVAVSLTCLWPCGSAPKGAVPRLPISLAGRMSCFLDDTPQFNGGTGGCQLATTCACTRTTGYAARDAGLAMYSVALSPDCRTCAVCWRSFDNDNRWSGVLELWNSLDGQRRRKLKTAAKTFNVLAFSPDGSMLAITASSTEDYFGSNILELWNVAEGRLVRTINLRGGLGISLGFSPDGHTLVVDGPEETHFLPLDKGRVRTAVVDMWDVTNGKLIRTFRMKSGSVGGYPKFSPDGETLAIGGVAIPSDFVPAPGSGVGVVELWSIRDGKLIRTLKTASHGVMSLAFSPDGKILASSGLNSPDLGAMEMWNVSTGTLINTLHTKDHQINKIAYSSDGRMLADLTWNPYNNGLPIGVLELRNASTGELLATLNTVDHVDSITFTPNNENLIVGAPTQGDTGSDIGIVEVWSTSTFQLLRTLKMTP